MGMQTIWLAHLEDFALSNWRDLVIGAAIAAILILLYYLWWRGGIPRDTTGNGIVIGQAKAFDNRSLSLRVERLNAGLETLKVVNQNVTDNLANFQQESSINTSRALRFRITRAPGGGGDVDIEKKEGGNGKTGTSEAARPDYKPPIGQAAGDVLNDQLNLASQIVSLQTLYERSLSDRMIDNQSRLQTVLGFQVSITPPAGYEDCVAIAEVAVRMRPQAEAATPALPVSLVALMPQEKTYNAQSVSNSERSIEGSAVARVLTLGVSTKGNARQLFVHRDSDTVAFERSPQAKPALFEDGPTDIVFGWEFRPVLGRRTVSPGTRQMLAVISLPKADNLPAAAQSQDGEADGKKTVDKKPLGKTQSDESVLAIRTRSYWRHYDRKRQTTAPNWGWLPWNVDSSGTVSSVTQELPVPNTAQIQSALEPKVTDINWVNSGGYQATVIVKGCNFFSGTKVVIGGEVHREEDHNLTLKSDQALEFETPIASLAIADAVLSGRFGPALKLSIPAEKLPVVTFEITRANIQHSRQLKAFYVSLDVKGLDADANYKDITVKDFGTLPEPILYIGAEPVPMPYDYYDDEAVIAPTDTAQIAPGTAPAPGGGAAKSSSSTGAAQPVSAKFVRVEAWISAKLLTKNQSVSFRVPFCGFEYQASMPLSFSEPMVDRMGASGDDSVFRIAYPLGFERPMSVELNAVYTEGTPQLQRITNIGSVSGQNTELILKVPTAIVSKYQYMLLRQATSDPNLGSSDTYLLKVPQEEKLQTRVTIDTTGKPPQVTKGSRGPLEWTGSALDQVTDVVFTLPVPPGQTAAAVSQPFAVYGGGTKLEVHLAPKTTETEGKLSLECITITGDRIALPFFVVTT
jgi:hypothetical protein